MKMIKLTMPVTGNPEHSLKNLAEISGYMFGYIAPAGDCVVAFISHLPTPFHDSLAQRADAECVTVRFKDSVTPDIAREAEFFNFLGDAMRAQRPKTE